MKILTMPALAKYANLPPSQVRLREIQRDLFFGKIFRGEKTQLKRIDIYHNSNLVVQVASFDKLSVYPLIIDSGSSRKP